VHATRGPAAVIAVAGDIPPELTPEALGRLSSVLMCRGALDDRYSADTFAENTERLRRSRVNVRLLEFQGGHEWSDAVLAAASLFLRERAPS